jgi:hypothetical protein
MHRIFIITTFWLAFALSAFGLSVEIPVTPTSLNQGTYLFSVTNSVIGDGRLFHISIKGIRDVIPSDSHVSLCIATRFRHGSQIIETEPKTPITLKKDDHLWKLDFVASSELLTNADVCLVFSVLPQAFTKDGKRVPIASCSFYEIKLHDFIKP